MTARAMLLSDEVVIESCRNYAQSETSLTGDTEERQEHLECAELDFEAGARYSRTLYEAERNRLLDEIEKLREMVKFRDDFMRERYRQAFADCFSELTLPSKHEEKGSE